MTTDVAGLVRAVTAYAEVVANAASADLERQVADRIKGLELWDYTNRPRTKFDPHFVLHGAEVDGRDDDQLSNPNSFPSGTHYFPQDHKGCLCRLRPTTRTVTRKRAGSGLGRVRWVLDSRGPNLGAARVGRSNVRVTRSGLPIWWDEVVNRQSWNEALRRAQATAA